MWNTIFRWTIDVFLPQLAGQCFCVFGFCFLCNWIIIANNRIHRRETSLIYLLGGVWGAFGLALLPSMRHLWWIPPIIEPSTPPTLYCLVREIVRSRQIPRRHGTN